MFRNWLSLLLLWRPFSHPWKSCQLASYCYYDQIVSVVFTLEWCSDFCFWQVEKKLLERNHSSTIHLVVFRFSESLMKWMNAKFTYITRAAQRLHSCKSVPLSNFMIDFAQGQSSSRGCIMFCCYTTNAVQPSALWSRRSRQTLFGSSLLILQYFPSKCFFLLLDHSALSFVNWWIKAGSLYTSTVWIAKQELTLTPLE